MSVGGWTELHDATLLSVELNWGSGEAAIRIRTGDHALPDRTILASFTRSVVCARTMPWGASDSINQVRGPMPGGDQASVVEVELQSGDVIRIEAASFELR